ncbi:MAG: hypothetical protein GY853_14615 [PVC group bacterium]|nr:hypothetical protein [PVC group bacterium]
MSSIIGGANQSYVYDWSTGWTLTTTADYIFSDKTQSAFSANINDPTFEATLTGGDMWDATWDTKIGAIMNVSGLPSITTPREDDSPTSVVQANLRVVVHASAISNDATGRVAVQAHLAAAYDAIIPSFQSETEVLPTMIWKNYVAGSSITLSGLTLPAICGATKMTKSIAAGEYGVFEMITPS